jgi:integrase
MAKTDDARLTLRQFYERRYRPIFLGEARPRTYEAYEATLAKWEWATDDPPLWRIDVQTLAAFRTALRTGRTERPLNPAQGLLFEVAAPRSPRRPLSLRSVRKHLVDLSAMLGKAGPRGPRARDALGIIAEVPWVRPPRIDDPLPREVDPATLERIYQACAYATRPALPGIRAEHWWQALILVAVLEGFRRGGLLAMTWQDVNFHAATIRLPADADKKGCPRLKPLAEAARVALLRIRPEPDEAGDQSRRLVFPFPVDRRRREPGTQPHSSPGLTPFYREWKRIQDAAGIPVADRIRPHDLKRFCATLYAEHSSPGATQLICDHRSLSTTLRSYQNPSGELRRVQSQLPLPAAIWESLRMTPPARSG